ncbi:MAG: NIPSNAP family protein [Micromonosporaceae bacterium]
MTDDLCCPILELRQYTLHPGRREPLIDLFDREFVETQEAAGMRVVGQFRDQNRPDYFVWVRGFRDMPSRAAALTEFYDGPLWAEHRSAAVANMIDFDDVLLLRPVDDGSGFGLPPVGRPAHRPGVAASSLIAVTVYHLDHAVDTEFRQFFTARVEPALRRNGITPIARLQTEPSENTFPDLPVRTGEQVFVWFARFTDPDQHRRQLSRFESTPEWTDELRPELAKRLSAPTQQLALTPTARSLLR